MQRVINAVTELISSSPLRKEKRKLPPTDGDVKTPPTKRRNNIPVTAASDGGSAARPPTDSGGGGGAAAVPPPTTAGNNAAAAAAAATEPAPGYGALLGGLFSPVFKLLGVGGGSSSSGGAQSVAAASSGAAGGDQHEANDRHAGGGGGAAAATVIGGAGGGILTESADVDTGHDVYANGIEDLEYDEDEAEEEYEDEDEYVGAENTYLAGIFKKARQHTDGVTPPPRYDKGGEGALRARPFGLAAVYICYLHLC